MLVHGLKLASTKDGSAVAGQPHDKEMVQESGTEHVAGGVESDTDVTQDIRLLAPLIGDP
jgi:hypothetical protein